VGRALEGYDTSSIHNHQHYFTDFNIVLILYIVHCECYSAKSLTTFIDLFFDQVFVCKMHTDISNCKQFVPVHQKPAFNSLISNGVLTCTS
jgi:hypothetical protein